MKHFSSNPRLLSEPTRYRAVAEIEHVEEQHMPAQEQNGVHRRARARRLCKVDAGKRCGAFHGIIVLRCVSSAP